MSVLIARNSNWFKNQFMHILATDDRTLIYATRNSNSFLLSY